MGEGALVSGFLQFYVFFLPLLSVGEHSVDNETFIDNEEEAETSCVLSGGGGEEAPV